MSIIKELKKKNASSISAKRTIAFDYLFGGATDEVEIGKVYLFEYDPKFKAFLRHWDKYPLTLVLDTYDDGFLGANLHYISPKARMIFAQNYLNKNGKVPVKLIHRYIFKRADNIFFKVPLKEFVEFAALPIEEFRDSKNRFVSAKIIQSSST